MAAASKTHAELERRAQDLIRIKNPTDERIRVLWDMGTSAPKVFPVEADGEAVVPRYIADKYVKEQVEAEITRRATEAIEKENKHRNKTGQKELDPRMDGDLLGFEQKFYTLQPEEYKEIAKEYIVGLETRFGIDMGAPESQPKQVENTKPMHRIVMDDLYDELGSSEATEEKSESIEDKKKKAVAKVSKK